PQPVRVDGVGVRRPGDERHVVCGREFRAVDAANRAGAQNDDVHPSQRAASRTIVLIFSMFGSRIGQVLSVATHCASPMPQPQLQRALFASTSAARFCVEVSDEKSTTRMARSLYATPDTSDSP